MATEVRGEGVGKLHGPTSLYPLFLEPQGAATFTVMIPPNVHLADRAVGSERSRRGANARHPTVLETSGCPLTPANTPDPPGNRPQLPQSPSPCARAPLYINQNGGLTRHLVVGDGGGEVGVARRVGDGCGVAYTLLVKEMRERESEAGPLGPLGPVGESTFLYVPLRQRRF